MFKKGVILFSLSILLLVSFTFALEGDECTPGEVKYTCAFSDEERVIMHKCDLKLPENTAKWVEFESGLCPSWSRCISEEPGEAFCKRLGRLRCVEEDSEGETLAYNVGYTESGCTNYNYDFRGPRYFGDERYTPSSVVGEGDSTITISCRGREGYLDPNFVSFVRKCDLREKCVFGECVPSYGSSATTVYSGSDSQVTIPEVQQASFFSGFGKWLGLTFFEWI